MFKYFNPNPSGNYTSDCVIRALCGVLGMNWEDVYLGVCLKGLELHSMPDVNFVWGTYLQQKGFSRFYMPSTCPLCFTVRDFCNRYSTGRYILATEGHVIAVIDGDYYDTSDTGDEVPIYFWKET